MNGRFLLDTNIIIALFANEQSVLDSARKADEVFIPAIVIGELYYGAEKSTRKRRNKIRIDSLVQANTILACDAVTARFYGQIKNSLKQKGRPIPENDIWISALARQHQLTLVTRDGHFDEIDLLEKTVW